MQAVLWITTGKMSFFASVLNQNLICELIMLATGVFAGELKSEAKKRCERAKPNAARL